VHVDALLIVELLLLGACGGFLAGLLGVGGGMILVPFTTVLLEGRGFPATLSLKVAVATSLASICFTSLSSLRAHHARDNVRWPVVAALTPGLVLGSSAGALVVGLIPVRLLSLVFGLFVAFMATGMLRPASPQVVPKPLPGKAMLTGVGMAIGAVSSWLGAGGAFMTVPYLLARQVPMHHAVGISAALGFPIALAGSLGYVFADTGGMALPAGMLGLIFLPALAGLSVASVLTAPLGARAAQRLNVKQLRRVFAVMLYGIAAYMLLRTLRG
jgi:uncharacterized membrane protein YfcA